MSDGNKKALTSAASVHHQKEKRVLPLPIKENEESDSANNVRMLLAKHQQEQRSKLLREVGGVGSRMAVVMDSDEDLNLSSNENFSSALNLPGSSYPDTNNQLITAEDDDVDGAEDEDAELDEKDLLQRLKQSQARMEQIKRMLVNQRGFIVQALRQLADQSVHTNNNNHHVHDKDEVKEDEDLTVEDIEERDRTLGGSVNYSVPQRHSPNHSDGRLCPMCEAAFPGDVDDEAFESHVVEHFCLEDADTLVYVPPNNEDS